MDNSNIPSLVQKDNKNPKYIRRLRDFEVLMLLLTYLKSDSQVQMIETKISQDYLKKMKLLNS